LVSEDHLVRKLDKALNSSFIYDLVEDLYATTGAESINPVVVIKLIYYNTCLGLDL